MGRREGGRHRPARLQNVLPARCLAHRSRRPRSPSLPAARCLAASAPGSFARCRHRKCYRQCYESAITALGARSPAALSPCSAWGAFCTSPAACPHRRIACVPLPGPDGRRLSRCKNKHNSRAREAPAAMADDAQLLADAKKLPLGDQLASSNWKVRNQALATVQERVGRAFSCEDEVFAEAGELRGALPLPLPTRRRCRRRHCRRRPALTPAALPARRPAACQGGGRLQCQRDGQGGGGAGGLPGEGR